jgi:hypothetical protein
MLEVDTNAFKKILDKIDKGCHRAWNDTGKYYKRITPKDTGNAQRNTQRTQKKIIANYPYAGRLDEGWSKQAPEGMTDPAIDAYADFIANRLRNL